MYPVTLTDIFVFSSSFVHFNVGRKQTSLQDIFSMQVSSIEWILGVQIQRFDNMYNVEMTNDRYCCCDNLRGPCEDRVIDLRERCNDADVCQPYFLVRFKRCSDSSTCLDVESYQLRNHTDLPLDQIGLYIPIDVESGENVKNLSHFVALFVRSGMEIC